MPFVIFVVIFNSLNHKGSQSILKGTQSNSDGKITIPKL